LTESRRLSARDAAKPHTRDTTPETNILLTSILTKIETEVLVFEQAL